MAVALDNKTARIVWALLARGGTYRAAALAAQRVAGAERHRGVGRTKEGMAHSRRDGTGKPRLSPVPYEHAMGDLDPARELHTGQHRHGGAQTGRTDGSIRLRDHPESTLALKGASTEGERPLLWERLPARRRFRKT
jgi:hypothetical protein